MERQRKRHGRQRHGEEFVQHARLLVTSPQLGGDCGREDLVQKFDVFGFLFLHGLATLQDALLQLLHPLLQAVLKHPHTSSINIFVMSVLKHTHTSCINSFVMSVLKHPHISCINTLLMSVLKHPHSSCINIPVMSVLKHPNSSCINSLVLSVLKHPHFMH